MDWAEQGVSEAKAVRKQLEKMSPSAERRDFAGIINAMVADAAGRELPGLSAITEIRKTQRLGRRKASDHNRAYAKFEALQRAAGGEGFNRLFPRNKMADAAPVAADIIGEDEALSQRYTPNLTEAKRLLDAAGRLAGARDYQPSGQPEAIAAEWLLTAARALVAAEREGQVQEAKHDMASGRIPLAGRR